MDKTDTQRGLSLEGYTVVFDLDGTLIDTAPDLVAALNACLSQAGYKPVPSATVQGQIGLGSASMIYTALDAQNITASEAEVAALRSVFLDHYEKNTAHFSAPYPGVLSALDRLDTAGAITAICTNKPQHLADILLDQLQIRTRFKAIVGSDSVPKRKPHPSHILHTLELAGGLTHQAIMVGDSHPDEKAAQLAELPFVFVPFGYGPIEQAQHSRVELESFDNLTPEFILNLF